MREKENEMKTEKFKVDYKKKLTEKKYDKKRKRIRKM